MRIIEFAGLCRNFRATLCIFRDECFVLIYAIISSTLA